MLDGLGAGYDRCIDHMLVGDVADHFFGFLEMPSIAGQSTCFFWPCSLKTSSRRPWFLVSSMLRQAGLEVPRLDHVGQHLHDLVLGVVDILLESVDEDIVKRLEYP